MVRTHGAADPDANVWNDTVWVYCSQDDTDLTASYKSVPVYKIESQAQNGIIVMSPEGGIYEEGTKVTLSARHDYFFEFDSWNGDIRGKENPVSIIVDSDKKINVLFHRVEEGEVVAEINCGGEEFRSKDGIVYSNEIYEVNVNDGELNLDLSVVNMRAKISGINVIRLNE